MHDGVESVWILEDDAIFRSNFAANQEEVAAYLSGNDWDFCYIGHTLASELANLAHGLIPFSGPFFWAHCYAVHRRVLPRLVDYLEETLINPPGHPRGGKVYIDAAYTLFRRLYPDVITLVSNPVLSVQRGSPSSLVNGRWYDHYTLTRPLVAICRKMRDEVWRRTGWPDTAPELT